MLRKFIGKTLEKVTIKKLRESIKARVPIKKVILDNGSGYRGSWDYGAQKDIFSIDMIYGDDSTKLGFKKEYFDMVVFAGVIQYIPSYDKAIKEIYRVLKPNGLFLITTINKDSLLRNIGLISKEPKYNEHKIFSMSEIEELLKKNKFYIVEKWGVSFAPFPFELCSNICYLVKK